MRDSNDNCPDTTTHPLGVMSKSSFTEMAFCLVVEQIDSSSNFHFAFHISNWLPSATIVVGSAIFAVFFDILDCLAFNL